MWGRLIWHPKKENPESVTYVRLYGQTKARLFQIDKIELAGDTETDCRTEEGITVGLIDSILSVAKVLKTRDLMGEAIQEALLDLQNDESIKFILSNNRIIDFEEYTR